MIFHSQLIIEVIISFQKIIWMFETIEEQHNVDFTPEFVKTYANEFENFVNSLEYSVLSDVESELECCSNVDDVADIEFSCFGYAFEWTNKIIKEGKAFIKK